MGPECGAGFFSSCSLLGFFLPALVFAFLLCVVLVLLSVVGALGGLLLCCPCGCCGGLCLLLCLVVLWFLASLCNRSAHTLRKSLQVKCSHLARCCEFPSIEQALHMSEQAVQAAVLSIIGRQECMLDVAQLRQPLRKGGLGLQCLSGNGGMVCKVGYPFTHDTHSHANKHFQ